MKIQLRNIYLPRYLLQNFMIQLLHAVDLGPYPTHITDVTIYLLVWLLESVVFNSFGSD